MINLAFLAGNRKIIRFSVDNKKIVYFDDIWKQGIQIMPKDQNIIEKLQRGRKPALKLMAKLIKETNSGSELKEYESCKGDEDVANMIRKDCKSKGLMEVK